VPVRIGDGEFIHVRTARARTLTEGHKTMEAAEVAVTGGATGAGAKQTMSGLAAPARR
jgi:hypothetical protein